jgi:hypothetical protein
LQSEEDMKLHRIALVPVLATMFVALVGCGGGKSSTANSAASAASQAVATAGAMGSSMKAGAEGAMQNATGAMGGEAAVPNCGAVKAVWVNLKSKVYHEPGDPAYGKTVHGEYLCPSQARAQGFRPAGGAMTSHHHRSSYSQ